MATTPMSQILQHLRATCGRDWMTDDELLTRFLDDRDEAALAALVRRHGPMVWGVCRRLLSGYHDAEDAFQATFLVLVQKAASLPNREKIGHWLYGVAHQTAVRMRSVAARRGLRERQMAVMPEPGTAEQHVRNDLLAILDEELSHLPDKYRVLIVLGDLEGMTRKELARELDLPQGTVASRVAAARAMLIKRLARRGVVVPAGLLAAELSRLSAGASVPATVIPAMIKAAMLVAAGQPALGAISPAVVALQTGVTKAMFMSRIKTAMAALLVCALTLGGIRGGVGLCSNSEATAPQSGAMPDESRKPDANEMPMQADKVGQAPKKSKVASVLTPTEIYRDQVEGFARVEFVVGAVGMGQPFEIEARERPRVQAEGGKATLTTFSATVSRKLEARLISLGIKDVRVHLYGKTVRVSGNLKQTVLSNEISTLITYNLVLEEIDQLESVSEQRAKGPGAW